MRRIVKEIMRTKDIGAPHPLMESPSRMSLFDRRYKAYDIVEAFFTQTLPKVMRNCDTCAIKPVEADYWHQHGLPGGHKGGYILQITYSPEETNNEKIRNKYNAWKKEFIEENPDVAEEDVEVQLGLYCLLTLGAFEDGDDDIWYIQVEERLINGESVYENDSIARNEVFNECYYVEYDPLRKLQTLLKHGLEALRQC